MFFIWQKTLLLQTFMKDILRLEKNINVKTSNK